MYIYNAEHYKDPTAAIAVGRAEQNVEQKFEPTGYLIGEVYRFVWEGCRIVLKYIA